MNELLSLATQVNLSNEMKESTNETLNAFILSGQSLPYLNTNYLQCQNITIKTNTVTIETILMCFMNDVTTDGIASALSNSQEF